MAALTVSVSAAVEIDLVEVGQPDNPPDSVTQPGLGAVDRAFEVGTHEVSNREYAEFLNAAAQFGDLNGLWNPHMTSSLSGGIERSGAGTAQNPHVYSTIPPFDDKPVNFVSWDDAARFVNWLESGQPDPCGDCTESGTYQLTTGSDSSRDPAATWALPTASEWYKAAFYSLDDGDGNPGYWLYPTQSDATPAQTSCDAIGDGSTPSDSAANYDFGCRWNLAVGNVATGGSSGRSSFFGTFDQAGNVEELLEDQTARGGDFFNAAERLAATGVAFVPLSEEEGIGFRVVRVPEPTRAALQWVALGCVGLLAQRTRHARRPAADR